MSSLPTALASAQPGHGEIESSPKLEAAATAGRAPRLLSPGVGLRPPSSLSLCKLCVFFKPRRLLISLSLSLSKAKVAQAIF